VTPWLLAFVLLQPAEAQTPDRRCFIATISGDVALKLKGAPKDVAPELIMLGDGTRIDIGVDSSALLVCPTALIAQVWKGPLRTKVAADRLIGRPSQEFPLPGRAAEQLSAWPLIRIHAEKHKALTAAGLPLKSSEIAPLSEMDKLDRAEMMEDAAVLRARHPESLLGELVATTVDVFYFQDGGSIPASLQNREVYARIQAWVEEGLQTLDCGRPPCPSSPKPELIRQPK